MKPSGLIANAFFFIAKKVQQFLGRVILLMAVVMSTGVGQSIAAQNDFELGDHPHFGRSLVLDRATGMYWLSLEVSATWQRSEILSEMGSGGIYEGFRYATREEVFQLLENFGFDLTLPMQKFWTQNGAAASRMFHYFGGFYNYSTYANIVVGFTAESVTSEIGEAVRVILCYVNPENISPCDPSATEEAALTGAVRAHYDDIWIARGHWLIWEGDVFYP